MKTITVQIGNSDDKLSQQKWSQYCYIVGETIKLWANEVHFSGGSEASAPWQNKAWVFVLSDDEQDAKLSRLKAKLIEYRTDFNQLSIAWTEGETEFI